MVSRISYIGFPVLGGVLLSIGLSACSDDTPATPAAETGGASAGGSPSTGGAATGGGGTSTGGRGTAGAGGGTAGSGGGDSGPPPVDYVCSDAKPRDPGGTGADGASCCSGAGKCAAPSTVTGDAAKSLGHDTCGATLVCAPTATTAPAKCTSTVGALTPAGLEGRCVPSCFMLGNPQALTLDNGGGDGGTACPTGELCAPCFNPVDGTSTGSCNTNGDAPTTTAPTPYAACPAANDAGQPVGGGLCVPASALANAKDPKSPIYNPALPGLKKGSCAADQLCVPKAKALNPSSCSAHCTTSSTTQGIGAQYKNGACTPEYVIFDVAGTTGITISTGGGPCPTGELCAPCQDPLNPGNPSGACY